MPRKATKRTEMVLAASPCKFRTAEGVCGDRWLAVTTLRGKVTRKCYTHGHARRNAKADNTPVELCLPGDKLAGL